MTNEPSGDDKKQPAPEELSPADVDALVVLVDCIEDALAAEEEGNGDRQPATE